MPSAVFALAIEHGGSSACWPYSMCAHASVTFQTLLTCSTQQAPFYPPLQEDADSDASLLAARDAHLQLLIDALRRQWLVDDSVQPDAPITGFIAWRAAVEVGIKLHSIVGPSHHL